MPDEIDAKATFAVGERIKSFRSKLEISQRELARRIGVSASYISAIERGDDKVNADVIIGIVNNFQNINAEWLLIGSGKMLENRDIIEYNASKLDEEAFLVADSMFTEAYKDSLGDERTELVDNKSEYYKGVYMMYLIRYQDIKKIGSLSDNECRAAAKEYCKSFRKVIEV